MTAAHPDDKYRTKESADSDRGGAVPSGTPQTPGAGPAAGAANPNKLVDVEKLRESMQWSARQLRPFRERNKSAIKVFAGSRYGSSNLSAKTPINLLKLAVNVWSRQLVSQTPQTVVLAQASAARPEVYELELALNYLLKTIDLGSALADASRAALFTMGIMKVGITDAYLPSYTGFSSESGQPYASSILFDDWLHDMNARQPEEWDWCCHRYRVSYEEVMENPGFDKRVKAHLTAGMEQADFEGFGSQNTRTSSLSTGDDIEKTEYKKRVDLWDMWLPADKLLVTLPVQGGLKPLQVREWDGPANGPFHLLYYSGVPGNLMPSAPAQDLYDLQTTITTLSNQLTDQAERQKTMTIVDGQAEADGTAGRIMNASDGQVIRTNHVDGVKEHRLGGVDQQNMQYVIWLKQMFSYLGGNLDAMGGLAQQANTLGQEELLSQSSSEMLRDMQSKVVKFADGIVNDLGWYLYTDPVASLSLTKNVDGYGNIPFQYGPDRRRADFYDHSIAVEPYSLKSKSPSDRLQTIMQIAGQTLLPLAPQMQQWGMSFDLKRYIELIAKYSAMPEISELVISETPMEGSRDGADQSSGERALQSPVTERKYTRTNVSGGGTQGSMENSLMQSLSSGGEGKGG